MFFLQTTTYNFCTWLLLSHPKSRVLVKISKEVEVIFDESNPFSIEVKVNNYACIMEKTSLKEKNQIKIKIKLKISKLKKKSQIDHHNLPK